MKRTDFGGKCGISFSDDQQKFMTAKNNKNVSLIFDFPRKRRCLYFTLSFTHLLRLKHQWFSVLNTCRI